MKKTRSTKHALLMSALALLLCVSMFVGSTFAWFTESIKSDRNIIQSGNLDVELWFSTWDAASNKWSDYAKVDKDTKVFKEGALFEPGYTEVVRFKVENLGSLALKYNLTATVYNEVAGTNVDEKEFNLSDYLYVGRIDGANDTLTREAAAAAATTPLKAGFALTEAQKLDVKGNTNGADFEEEFVFVLSMPETIGNEANHKVDCQPAIELGIALVATQYTNESDSFNDQYDAKAWDDVAEAPVVDAEGAVEVWTAEQLAGVMADISGIKTINIMENIDLGSRAWTPANFWGTGTITINGNGHVISNMQAENDKQVGFIGKNSRNITINDLTFVNADIAANNFGGTVIGYAYGNITLNNVDVDASFIQGIGNLPIRMGGLIGFVPPDGGSLTLTNCDVTNSTVSGYHNVGAMVGTTMTKQPVTVTSCTAKNNKLVYSSYNVGAFAFGAGDSGYTEYVPTSGFTAENIDVSMVIKTDATLKAAIENGETVLLLAAGTYQLPENDTWWRATKLAAGTKIIGIEDGVMITPVQKDSGASEQGRIIADNYTFENVTFTNTVSPSGYGSFVDCTFNGENGLRHGAYKNGDVTFTNCAFNNADGWAFHTEYIYGVKVTFEGCTFNGLIEYTDTIDTVDDVYFNDCTFAGSNKTTSGKIFCAWKKNAVLTDCTGYDANTFAGVYTEVEEGLYYQEGASTLKVVSEEALSAAAEIASDDTNITSVDYNGTEVPVVRDTAALEDAVNNTTDGAVVVAGGTYTFPGNKIQADTTIVCAEDTKFENGAHLNINGATVVGGNFESLATHNTVNGTYKGCTFTGSNALRYGYAGDTVVFEDCVFDGNTYGVHFDSGANEVLFKNCTLSGFNAMGSGITKLTMEGCTFKALGNSGYNGINLWGNTDMIDCTFVFDGSATYEWVDLSSSNQTVTFTGCVVTDGTNETPLKDVVGNYGDNNTIIIDGVTVNIPNMS